MRNFNQFNRLLFERVSTTLIFRLAASILTLTTGCTHYELKQRTAAEGNTLTDLEYRMILDNLAEYKYFNVSSPHTLAQPLPSYSLIQAGTVQVTDTLTIGNPNIGYTYSPWSWMAGFSPARKWQDSWTLVPVTDGPTLTNLQAIFEDAVLNNTNIHYGSVAPVPDSTVSGHYRTMWAWVNNTERGELTKLTLKVIGSVTNSPTVTAGPGYGIQ